MNDNRTLFATKKNRTQKIIAGLTILGGTLAFSAILLQREPAETSFEAEPVAQTEPAPEPPAWAQAFEPTGAEAAEAEPAADSTPAPEPGPVAEAPEPEPEPAVEIALEHGDEETDFHARTMALEDEGDLKGAFTALRKHLFDNPPTPEMLLYLGELGREIGELEIAEAALEKASALDATRADVMTELARVRLDAGDLDGAQTASEKATDLDRESPEAWNLYGRVAMAQSEWQRSELALRHALELDPARPIFHNNLGLLYVYMKRGPDAVDSLETAVELYEGVAPHFVFNNLGLAHELAGNYLESREAFEEALLVDPLYTKAKVNLRRLETTIATLEEKSAFETATGPDPAELEITEEDLLDFSDDT